MREAGKSYLWCTGAWFRTKPGTTARSKTSGCVTCRSAESIDKFAIDHLRLLQ